ncbi:MAG: tRNA uridine-5-carboxymethylaminomethyl(34) synthesis GTPase MnmE [Elusimicrobiaceae bacterium]|nr:tRNA uridine-5-carboxymethylaminomethyl(34) synthesis GTPase MnmE [Elusimicrobiaceae bacterium]
MDKTLALVNRNDTIAAAATGPAGGAVALVRLSGPQAVTIAGRFLRGKQGAEFPPAPRTAVLMRVQEGEELLDRAVVVFFRAPASYTGDDVFEISCHGSPYITARVLGAALKNGARAAEPGEFSMRAFLNGKLDLAQAEGLCDLILSKNAAAHKAALSMTEGKVSDGFKTIKDDIVALLAETEARIDDADDEIPPLDRFMAGNLFNAARARTKRLAGTFELGKLMKNGIAVAIAGAPNAGKSSLLNALAGCDRAIVAPTPGTTRDTIEQSVDLEGFRLILTDTAGLRSHALDPAELEGMRRTEAAIKKADFAIIVCSAETGFTETDRTVLKLVSDAGKPFIVALNKTDLADTENAAAKLAGAETVCISCKTLAGIEALKSALIKTLPLDDLDENSAVVTSARHYACLLAAETELARAETLLLADPAPFELAAVHLNAALRELEGAVGDTAADEILGAVFSRFCVGK